jgi:hypothetical protein
MIVNTHRLFAQLLPLLRVSIVCDVGSMATDQPRAAVQFNALFVRSDLRAWARARIAVRLLRARARMLTVRAALALCPACVRTYQRVRAGGRE